jgi:serine/threonine protein kinase/Flp pilus assembly protein TadD
MTPPPVVPVHAGGRDPTAESRRFVPGELFAGRFRIITWLGQSDSGDVWHAEDLVLQTPVALKIIQSATAENRERILKEVRLALQITNPSARRVFDVGEAEGIAFCSMEMVEGEDLSVLIRRAGRFPPERVVEIGIQLCDALAAAHAAGVVHGDVRPENVLVDRPGFVKLTDFGIAAAVEGLDGGRSRAHSPYAAPEQQSPPESLTDKSDIYALGALLYELLTGRLPTRERGKLQPPSALVPDVPEELERTILQALHPTPRRRPSSAAMMAAQLSGIVPVTSAGGRSVWLAGGALAITIAALVIAAAALPSFRRGAPVLTEKDTVIIADVLNTTSDPVFDGALKVALAVALEQSPFLKIFPDERIREALQLMRRKPDEARTRDLARDIARREGLKAVVFASIASLGSHYVLSIEAVDAGTGDVMAREQAEVAGKEEVLTALGDTASRLRARLGDALASEERFDAPLARATTPSLEALHSYSRALDGGRVNPRPEAIPYLTHAIELDPDFAMAHAMLSGVYANTGRFADAPEHARRAFELRDRVSEFERFIISWRYYLDAAQAWDAALVLATSWTTTYPREPFAFNSLGLASAAFGDHARAVDAFREAIRLDSRFVPPHGNLAGSLVALGRYDEAQVAIDEAARLGIDTTGIRRVRFLLSRLSAGPDPQAMAAAADPLWTSTWEARDAAAAGRFAAAHALYGRAIDTAVARRLGSLAAQWTMEDAELAALAGDCDRARGRSTEGLQRSRDNFTLERASRTLGLCGDAEGVSTLVAELASRFSEATLTRGLQIPVSRAALSLSRNQHARVVELLEPVRPYDHAPSAEFWSKYLRGEGFRGTRNWKAAADQFQAIVAHSGEAPSSPLFALAHLGLARSAAAAGDPAAARAAYERFFALWANADELPALAAARREYAGLRG